MGKHQLFSIILCRHYQENTSQLVLSQRTKLQQIRKSIKHKTSSIYGDLNVAMSIQRGRSEVKNLLPRLEAKMPFLSKLVKTWAKFLLVIVQVNKSMRKHILPLCFCTTNQQKFLRSAVPIMNINIRRGQNSDEKSGLHPTYTNNKDSWTRLTAVVTPF